MTSNLRSRFDRELVHRFGIVGINGWHVVIVTLHRRRCVEITTFHYRVGFRIERHPTAGNNLFRRSGFDNQVRIIGVVTFYVRTGLAKSAI